MKHTKEPWSLLDGCINNPYEKVVLPTAVMKCSDIPKSEKLEPLAEANATRIVECVNALAGVSHPAEYIQSARDAVTEALKIKKQLVNLTPLSTPPERHNVLAEVSEERIRQDAKWGEQNHHPFPYLAILGEEVGEANKAAVEAYFGNDVAKWQEYRKELVQVAAVAVAMIEALDRSPYPQTDL